MKIHILFGGALLALVVSENTIIKNSALIFFCLFLVLAIFKFKMQAIYVAMNYT